MNILAKWIVSALVVWVVAYLLPGVEVSGVLPILIFVVVFGLVNILLKPLLLLLTLPINVITLGLFTLVINGFLVLLASSLVPGFYVNSFLSAVWFSLLVSLFNWFLNRFDK